MAVREGALEDMEEGMRTGMTEKRTEKKRIVRICLAGIVAVSALISFVVAADRGRIRARTEASLTEGIVSFVIDDVQITEDVTIQGWALILGEEIENVNCNVMLVGEEYGKQWILPTMIMERNDLTEAFSDGTDYSKAGFLANIRTDRLSLEKEDYRIYLEYLTNGHSYLVPTDRMVRAVRETLWQETENHQAGISFQIDSVAAKNKVLTISGWLFRKGDRISQTKTEVLLLNSRTGKAYTIPTDQVKRADLAESFLDSSLEEAGFTASLEVWRFDFGYDNFEVCLRYANEEQPYLIHTGQYVNLKE